MAMKLLNDFRGEQKIGGGEKSFYLLEPSISADI